MSLAEMESITNENSSRIFSSSEVEDCIKNAGPIFRVLSAGGKMPLEIISPYDTEYHISIMDGFSLRPPTIFDHRGENSFGSRVYSAWLREGTVPYKGIALPGMTFVESTSTFKIDALGPSYPGAYFLNEAGLRSTLQSLSTIAVREAVKQHLTEGGDERLHINPEHGGNKYFCPPHPVEDMIIRGSCTCSPPSRIAFDAACDRLNRLWSEKISLDDASADLRNRISKALGIQTSHHIVLHPSGTDAEFTPLVIGTNRAKELGCSGVVNLVVGAGEVGSNTPNAAGGSHFSKILPSGKTDTTASLCGEFTAGTQVIEIKARNQDGTMKPGFENIVVEAMREAASQQERPFFIMHAVDGSKLGSHITTRDLVIRMQAEYGDRVLVVLDSCQARTEREELDWYLARGSVVLVTASKFYGAPGFCAAALIPDSIASQLKSGATVPAALGDYLTKYEVPSELEALRSALPEYPSNIGLHMRWTCGVTEMERLAKQPVEAREAIRGWVAATRDMVKETQPSLQLMEDEAAKLEQPSQLGGVNSIVSFKIFSYDGSAPLKTEALRKIHFWLTLDLYDMLPDSATEDERRVGAVKCFIGQPVDLGDFAILRLAMGNLLACDIAEDLSCLPTLEDDRKILDKILLCVKHFDALKSL